MNRTPVADWQQLSALYERADALDPAALGEWLAELRGQAHPLLPQLEQMLIARSQVQANGFLGSLPKLPPTLSPEPLVTDWAEGSHIGPYRLLRHLGAGGMAEVWMAQRDDGAFQRTVAIKLLFRHAGSSQRDSFAQRFARERDILASLHHPNIAGLHDAGVTPTGQPWLALEYVEGQTLTEWCDAQRLGVAARVRLFRQVLLAVQHAHANLVIHRDLKPGNILVTPQGEVRLLDFGIAKLMEQEGSTIAETELTRVSGRPMTPQYAAPEQLLGQPLTTACDVYSLGVVLYELLCGERPYELKVASAAQLEQAVLDVEPRGPSRRASSVETAAARGTTSVALHKLLANDLDAITLRALAKRPAQRYGSVEALRADLDRWLDGEPVEARAPSTVYRVGKFVQRHVLSVSLGAGAVVALVAVAAVAVVMGVQAREDSARAVAARDFMLNIFARANQEKSRGADITARDLLETGRKDVLVRLTGQPRLQAELLRGIAKIQSDMGEYVTADSTYAELVHIYQQTREPREEAMARADHAFNAVQMNNLALATRLFQAAESTPGRPGADPELNARFAEIAGWIALNGGDARRAEALLSAGRSAAIDVLGPNHLRTFKLGRALFRAERNLRNVDRALELQEELRRAAAHVVGLDADEIGAMDLDDVNLLLGTGRFAQALPLAERALSGCVDVLGAGEQSCRLLFVKKGQALLRLGKVDQAMQDIQRLQAMTQDTSLPYLQVEALLLELRLRSKVQVGAEPPASLVERVRAFGQSGPAVAMQPTFKAAALLALAEARLRVGDPAQAQQWIDLALGLVGRNTAEGDAPRIAAIADMLTGIALLQQDRLEEALERLERSRGEMARLLSSEHPITQLVALNSALTLVALKRVPEALAVVRHAEPVLRDAFGVDAPSYREVLSLLQRLGNSAGATAPTSQSLPRSATRAGSLPKAQLFFS
jgi:eukaryotic-like serine/threonine-protein kinase